MILSLRMHKMYLSITLEVVGVCIVEESRGCEGCDAAVEVMMICSSGGDDVLQ